MFDRERLRSYIKDHGIKQTVIAERTGIHPMALSNILSGNRKCEASEYAQICKALNVPLEKFITR